MRHIGKFMVAFVASVAALGAGAQNLIYGDSAGSNRIDVINRDTGALIRSCSPNKGNGRGMVVVGNIAYFTVAGSNNVFKIDINTCADLGIAFSVAGATGLSTIAYDGTNFWIGDYSGTNNAYYYSPTGALLKTIALTNCTGFCDGLEFFNGKLISNRGDAVGPYDVYDTNGALLTPAFINFSSDTTGIAYDGTFFYVSLVHGSLIKVFDGTTGAFVRDMPLTNGSGFLIEDLSTDYAQRQDTGGGGNVQVALPANIPTLSEWALILLSTLLALAAVWRMRKRGM
ncbi:MAG TPA: IPTL-CTERM sorting domain-containing protein [Burkholderiales bacterium]|nr:IPTL-CTERM sorting domain-containing protein [Burkholderiales bacterium]